MSVKQKTYPNDPRDVAQGCAALIAMLAVPGFFLWGLFTMDWTTLWKIGVSVALFIILANGWFARSPRC